MFILFASFILNNSKLSAAEIGLATWHRRGEDTEIKQSQQIRRNLTLIPCQKLMLPKILYSEVKLFRVYELGQALCSLALFIRHSNGRGEVRTLLKKFPSHLFYLFFM